MKKIIKYFLAACIVVLNFSASHAKPSLNLNNAMEYVIRHTPPVFTDIKMAPNPAVAGQDIQIQAFIQSKIELKKVLLHYRIQGSADWKEVEFEQDVDNEKLWVAALPAQTEGTVIEYTVSANNEDKDKTLELTKLTSSPVWPPSEGNLPALTSISDNYEDSSTPADLDITGLSFAYDETYFYFQCDVKGSFSAGIFGLDNSFIHVYALGMLHGLEPFAIYYAPYAAQANYPQHAFVKAQGGKPVFDEKAFESKFIKHSMFVRLKREALGAANKLDLYRFVFLTGALLSVQPLKGELEDITPFVHVYLREPHTFTVKKEASAPTESGTPTTADTSTTPTPLTDTPKEAPTNATTPSQ